jgi:hypothetical protein
MVHPDEIPEALLYQLLTTGAVVKAVAKNGVNCLSLTKGMPGAIHAAKRQTTSSFLSPIATKPLPSASSKATWGGLATHSVVHCKLHIIVFSFLKKRKMNKF